VSDGLIRFARRLANWEEPLPVEELQKREFKARDGGPDLRPSVYRLTAVGDRLVQVYAEHAYQLDPQAGRALDVALAAEEVVVTPGEAPFSFSRAQHREIVMADLAELHRFIESVRDAAPRYEVTKAAVKDYVRSRLTVGDEEWLSAANDDGARSWLKKLANQVRADAT
jgi:hypothetical protein